MDGFDVLAYWDSLWWFIYAASSCKQVNGMMDVSWMLAMEGCI